MQLIQRTTLLYQSGKSDKVYEVDLAQIEEGRYVVNFRYGRRGKALREGVQTDEPISCDAAQTIFDKLVAAKVKKGYRDVSGQDLATLDPMAAEPPEATESGSDVTAATTPETASATTPADSVPDPRVAAILKRLELGLRGDEGTGPNVSVDTSGRGMTLRLNIPELTGAPAKSWPLNRVIWRAGELRMAAAAPLLIQLLARSPLRTSPLRNYCLAWALGNCGDPAAIAPLSDLYARCDSDALNHVRRIALAALLKLSNPQQRDQRRGHLINQLPEHLRALATNGPAEAFAAALREDLESASPQQVTMLDLIYQINNEHVRPALLEVLQTAPFRPPYFQCLRHIFKLAEYNQDAEAFAILAYRFEQEEKGYRGSHWYIRTAEGKWISRYIHRQYNRQTRRWEQDENPEFVQALSGSNAKVAFSENTKNYLTRRVWRSLKRLGDLDDPSYVALATHLLLQFADDDAEEIRSRTCYRWDRNWRRTESGQVHWDSFAGYVAFNHILYTHSPRYSYKHGQKAWRCEADYQPGDPAPAEREEAFPTLWEQQPSHLLRLLLESQCQPVHEFAAKALRTCEDFCQRLDLDCLIDLFRQPYATTAELAFDLARDRYKPDDPNLDLVLAVANCAYAPARAQAYDWIAAQRDRFLNHAPLIAALMVSPEAETRAYARQLLSAVALLPPETVQLIAGQAIAILLTFEEPEAERAQDAIQTLQDRFVDALKPLGLTVVLNLLRHSLEPLQVFGAWLLLNHETAAADLPPGLIDALLESPTKPVRVIGVQLLGTLPDAALMRKPELLMLLATHELPDMRDAICPALVRLLTGYPDFCDRLLPILILELQQPEAHEGVHDFLVRLLGQDVTDWMAKATTEQTWQLLEAEASAAQELAGHILRSRVETWHQQLTLPQMGELTHHEIQSVRTAGCAMMQQRLPELRVDPEKLLYAVAVLESPWDDARDFGFQLFTEQLQPEDFTPSLIVSICDNNLPDIRKLGRDILGRCFKTQDGQEYLMKFSEHPAQDMQLFATNYLEGYAANHPERLRELQPYFTIVLGQVNRSRVAKQRIFRFLSAESAKSRAAAETIAEILTRQSAAIAIRDKSQAIEILLKIRKAYPDIETPISVKPVPVRT